MSAQFMVDVEKLARGGERISGMLPIDALPRLAQQLGPDQAPLAYELAGSFDQRQRPTIHCIIRGELLLVCQRCLNPLSVPVATDSMLTVVRSEGDLPPIESDDEVEFVVAARELDVAALVEDEILLSLPIAPRHKHDCVAQATPR